MEASRFGFGSSLSPTFKFDPTDDDIVAHYLLPRALGYPNPPFGHAVIEADTGSLSPPELLALHDHATSHHAFFVSNNGGRREREIKGGAGGTWRGQQGKQTKLTLLRPGGGAVDIEYKRYDLTYKIFGEEDEEEDAKGKKRKRKSGGTPSGWVMHEYTIVSPPLPNIVLSRINRKAGNIKEDQHHQVFTALEQPGPSYKQDYFPYQEQAGPSHRHDFSYQEQPGPSHHHDFSYQEQAGPSHHNQDFSYQEQPGPSHHYDFSCQEQAGPSHHQDFPYQEQAGPSNQHDFPYLEQAWPSHHGDFSYQQQAGPGPSMGGGEGFSDSSQADDAFWYGDNVSGMGGGFVNLLRAGEDGFASDSNNDTYCHQPIDMCCSGQGFSDGSQADDASLYVDNAGGTGNGYDNMICAGVEEFAGVNTYNHHPHDMTCGGGQADDASNNGGGIGAGTMSATETTCTRMTSTCQVAATSSPADDQDKS